MLKLFIAIFKIPSREAMKYLSGFVLLLSAILLHNSCEKKQTAEPVTQQRQLRIQQMVITSYTGAIDTFRFSYNQENDLKNVAFGTFASALLDYDHSILENIGIDRFNNQTGMYETAMTATLSYTNNELSGLLLHSPEVPMDSFVFDYDAAGRIRSAADWFEHDTLPGLSFDESDFTYNNSGDITGITTVDSVIGFEGSGHHVQSLEFDDETNPFLNILPFFTLSQYDHLSIFDLFGQDMAIYASQHNVTKITFATVDPSWYTYSYQYNQLGYPTQISKYTQSVLGGNPHKIYDCTIIYEAVP